MSLSRLTVAALAAAALTVAGCGGDGGGSSGGGGDAAGETAAGQVTVKIASYKYLPETVRVRAGGTIAWENEDDADTHDAESVPDAPGDFDTQAIEFGERKRVTLDEPGTYAYFCSYHRFMEGTVEVVPDGR